MVNFGGKTILLLLISIHIGSARSDEYDECPEIEGPTVWIDNAPDCQANSSYCHHFGLDYVCSTNITDEGNSCLGGTQVKCAHSQAPPLATPLPINTLKLITYNVWELNYLVAQIGQRERTCRIPAKIFKMNPDVDVVVLEEVFMGGCIVNVNNSLTMRDILGEFGFVHSTRTVGDSLALLPGARVAEKRNSTAENGGVFIASRWPIVQEKQKVFDNYDPTTSDALSAKGVMYARVRKTVEDASKDFHIFGTHMQSTEKTESPGIRVLQAGEIFDFMQGMSIPISEPVIYTGDLNGDLINKEENARAIIDALNANMPSLIGPIKVTYDHQNNDNLDPTDKDAEYLDYILTSNGHEQPVGASTQVFRPRSDQPVEVCRDFRLFKFFMYPHSPDCRETKTVSDLSDHFPVVGIFQYPTDKAEMTTQAPGVHTTSSGSSPVTGAVFAVVTSLTVLINSHIFKKLIFI
ncbi:sphingomyelinase C-like [Patiria miniata]|uniref:sphingomyelin phosphodiesterase n=1 Tax=Patiria miniata TaxID=46514 RepID=A0A914B727_PATMI|nr:sphingomyelinase C-like [Patiria miniata]